LDAMKDMDDIVPILPIWKSYYNLVSRCIIDANNIIDAIGKNSFHLRNFESLALESKFTLLEETLPFLRGSCCGQDIYEHHEKEKSSIAITSSLDAFFILQSSKLDVKWKADQVINEYTIADEGMKSILGKGMEKHTLLIAGFNVDPILKHKGDIVKFDNMDVAILIKSGSFPYTSEFKKEDVDKSSMDRGIYSRSREFVIPDGMDIVILLNKELDFLLTPQYVKLLRNPEHCLDTVEHVKIAQTIKVNFR
jgi:hypothetical protein